jgi:Zn-dependent peptidase ImmA (M78 family)/transcriptional regulator with XRE-family HTH domain
MEKIEDINPQRIAWCCEEQDLTVELLAQEVNIAASTLQQVMMGKGGLSVNQLRKIATYFNRGLLFFLEENPVNEERLHSPQFRTLTNQKTSLSPKLTAVVERMERQRQVYISLLEDLGEESNQAWHPTELTLNLSNIKQSAATVRQWLGLGDNNSLLKLRQAIEAKGILVFISNGYNGPWQIPKESLVRGFSLYYPTFPIIAIKKQSTEGPQAFTMMHELAHLLLHQESVMDEEKDFYSHRGKERQANDFAGNILVPDSFINQVDLYNFPGDKVQAYDQHLKDLCDSWCVSAEVILRRLLDEGHIVGEQYQAYRQWKQSLPIPKKTKSKIPRTYRHREPNHIFGQPFVRTVFDALDNKQITLAKASTYLDNLKIKDLRKLEETYVHI